MVIELSVGLLTGTEVSQGNSDVGLAAAEGGLERGSLNETLVIEGLQAEHQLAKSDNLCHDRISPVISFFSVLCGIKTAYPRK